MPRGDGTGPTRLGGRGEGVYRNNAPSGGRGRNQGPLRGGPGGYCVCPQCQTRMEHDRATPCNAIKCPKCGTAMNRA